LLPTAQLAALGQSGKLIWWGDNAPYHLNEFPNFNTIDIAQVAMGEHHALALTKNGSVYGWGTNIKGELTIPSIAQTGVVQIAVGQYHCVAL
jgi:alpha-tubulin suppressor-like RCC1 family protein